MVARKFLKHFKNHNWLGLSLDFIVVVLGIFLGLQASDWNQSRIDRRDAGYHLDFLNTEVSAAMISAAEEIQQHQNSLMNSFGASMLLTKSSWDDEELRRFKAQVFSTFELWGPKHRPVSLRRMIDDRKLDLIESKDLQRAILQFDAAYLEAIEQTKTSYNYSLAITPKITASLKFEGPEVVSTREELLADSILRSAVRDKAVWQRIQLEVLDELQEARVAISKALKLHVQSADNED